MKYDSVCWAEGLFLKPHHLQQADLYWHELIQSHGRLDQPYNYGLFDLEVNQDLLSSWQFEVVSLRGRMKDGSYVAFDGRLDLSTVQGTQSVAEELRENGSVLVYLAVPAVKTQSPNVGDNNNYQARFQSLSREVFDFGSGENPQSVELQRLNLHLRVSTQPMTGFDHLPLCRLELSNTGERTPIIDSSYVPPTIRCNGCAELRDLIRLMDDHIASHLEIWSQELFDRNVSFSSYTPEALKGLVFVQLLGEMKAWLSCLINSAGLHPFNVYQGLCQWLGKLATVNPQGASMIPRYPVYDHEKLGDIFHWLMSEIDQRLFMPADSNVKVAFFQGHREMMKVQIEPAWFDESQWRLHFGLNLSLMPSSDREPFVKQIFFGQKNKLYWKMGAQDRIQKDFDQVAAGVSVSKLEKQKAGLAKRPIWIFADFKKDRFWEQVKQTYTLCFRVDPDRIYNLNELEGNRDITVTVDEKLYKFQIAVFAVKK